MGKITLDDLVKKDTSEVTAQIQKNVESTPTPVAAQQAAPVQEEQAAAAPAEVAAESKPEEKEARKRLSYDKSLLRGKFTEGTEFKKGEKHTVVIETEAVKRTDVLEVLRVEKSAGRVKFKDEGSGETFSISFTDLFGKEKGMPFKKGDVVKFEEKDYEVKGLNPASQNVVLLIEGKQRYVKISKVTLVLSAPVPAAVEAPAVAPASPEAAPAA